MVRAGRWLVRTLIFVAAGTVAMVLLTQAYALTQTTCTSICNPRVSAPLGAMAGFITALLLPSLSWKRMDLDEE